MTPRTRRSICGLTGSCIAFFVTAVCTPVRADPMYTITDLGAGNITLTTASGGTLGLPNSLYANDSGAASSSLNYNQIASVSNGQSSYAFQTTADTALNSVRSVAPNIPAPTNTPYSASYVGGGLLNGNGVAAFLGWWNINSDTTIPIAYYAQRNADGSWTQPTQILSAAATLSSGNVMGVAGLNKAGQILLGTSYPNTQYDALVYI